MMQKLALSLMMIVWMHPVFARDAEQGKPAPQIDARTLDGRHFTLTSQLGKVVIVNFWATWCPPCRKEMPTLEAYYEKHRKDGLELLAVSVDVPDDLAKVREVMKAYKFPAALLSNADVPGYGRIRQIPQTYVIDRRGILRRDGDIEKGPIDQAMLEKLVTPLLQTGVQSAENNVK